MKDRWLFAAGLLMLIAFYVPTLSHGYFNDDYDLIGRSFTDWMENPFAYHGRPVWTLSFLASDLISKTSQWHHAVNLLLFAAVGVASAWLIRRDALPSVAYLLALAALSHPAMVWPVSWISQRNDLLLVLFTILALGAYTARGGVFWVLFSCLSKAPFVFQGLVFSCDYIRRRRLISTAAVLVAIAASLYFVWKSYYLINVDEGARLYLVDLSNLQQLPLIVLLRTAKILEGIFYTFIPMPAYATGLPLVSIVSGSLICLWGYLIVQVIRNRRLVAKICSDRLAMYLAIAVTLSLPYAFSSGLRIYVPATLFIYLAAAFLLPDTRGPRVALISIFAIHLFGSILNYGPMQTGHYDLAERVTSRPRQVPAERWNALRRQFIDRVLDEHRENAGSAGSLR